MIDFFLRVLAVPESEFPVNESILLTKKIELMDNRGKSMESYLKLELKYQFSLVIHNYISHSYLIQIVSPTICHYD